MRTVPLSDWVDELESGARPKGGIKDGIGEVPSLGAEHLADDGGFNFAKDKRIPYDFFRSMKKGRIQTDDILIVKDGATTGKVSFVSGDFPYEEAAINEHVFRLGVSRKKADPRFVFRYLQSQLGQQQIMSDFRGATVGGIGRTFLDKVFLPDVALTEQHRIASILDKADAIRRKREKSLACADDFLMSMFLEMFGDPITNDRQLPTASLAELTLKITDGEHQNPEFVTTGMPIVMAKQVQFDRIDIAQAKSVSIRDGLSFRRKCNPELGDILIVGRGATIGRCYAVDIQTEFCLMGSVILIKPDPRKISSRYLLKLLTHPGVQAKLVNTSSSSAQQAIYLSHLKEMKIVLPKIADQRHFEKLADAISRARLRGLESLHNSKKLFDSLSQRAFRGEL